MMGTPLNNPSPRDLRVERIAFLPGTPRRAARLHIVVSTTRNMAMNASEGWATTDAMFSYCEDGVFQPTKLIGVSEVSTEDGARPIRELTRQEAEQMRPMQSGRFHFSISLVALNRGNQRPSGDIDLPNTDRLRDGRDICFIVHHGTTLGFAQSRGVVVPGSRVAAALAGAAGGL